VAWQSPEWDNWAHGPRDALWGEDGWCNFDLGKQNLNQLSVRCGCYDGWEGPLCNVPTESYCLNHCSDRGTCNHGFCECRPGFFGVDCSIQAQEEETQQVCVCVSVCAGACPRRVMREAFDTQLVHPCVREAQR
jgi:hypothetical protein